MHQRGNSKSCGGNGQPYRIKRSDVRPVLLFAVLSCGRPVPGELPIHRLRLQPELVVRSVVDLHQHGSVPADRLMHSQPAHEIDDQVHLYGGTQA
jgi:hypothetical protein